jgi:hydroxymethylbilane synthase
LGVYPIALDLHGKLAVVVGAGAVAARKVRGLLAAGARVRVIGPSVVEDVREAAADGSIDLVERPFEADDVAGAVLVYTTTPNAEVNAAVVAAAQTRGILVDDTTGAGASDFSTPIVHRVGSLTFAVDTGGSSPSFAMRLLDEIRARYDEKYARAAETLARARDYTKSVVDVPFRGPVMRALAARDIADLAAMNPSIVENEVEEIYEGLLKPADARPDVPFRQLVVATRASQLAMWQTRHVMGSFARHGLISTVLQISTKGDRVQDRSLAALGTDSIFVKELELALRDGRADYAVHSCKDLPSSLPDDMHLAAIGSRVDPRDAFCSERYASIDDLPHGALIGTSSPRRRAQLQALRPDLRFETIRGNVDTRLRKLRDGGYDAILLAMAGLERLELAATFTVPIDVDVLIPAVGQGALAIETRANDPELAKRIATLFSDPATDLAVRAERAFLRTLRGGCQAPVGAYAVVSDGTLHMHAAICAIDGSTIVRGSERIPASDVTAAERLGESLARRLLADGGEALLADVGERAEQSGLAAADAATSDAPLAGRLLLLPRTQDRPSSIAPALRGAGAEVIEVGESDDAVLALGGRTPQVLLFPSSGSVRAILAFLDHLRTTGVKPVVAAMGEASSAAASDAGFPPDVVATEATVGAFVQSVTHYLIGRDVS